MCFFFQAEDGIRDLVRSRGLGDVYKRQHHIKNNIKDKRNTILLVGYCSPDSLGGRLAAGNKEVRIFGKEYEVICDVYQELSLIHI